MSATSVIVKTRIKRAPRARLIISLGKSISKKAHKRNKLRRRIRTVLRPLLKGEDRDFLVLVRPEALNKKFEALREDLLNNLKENKKVRDYG